MVSFLNTFTLLLSLASVAIGIGPSIEIYNTDTEDGDPSTASFSIRTTKSLRSYSHIKELDFTLPFHLFCYTGV